MCPRTHSGRLGSQRGSALVIVLAALLLVCGLIILFFQESTLQRQISFSSGGQYRADVAAHTALDTIVGDLRTEIAAGSTAYTSNSYSIYIPTTNQTVVPALVLPSSMSSSSLPNLVKQSVGGDPFWPTGSSYYDASIYNPIRSVSGNSTMTPALGGRYIAIDRWNKAGLLGDPGTITGTNSYPSTYTTPPDWVLITRQGAVTNAPGLPPVGPAATPGTLADSRLANLNYVVGRYACIIYDEGGLADVNIAGFPSSVSGSDFTMKRGLLPQVDLGAIPGVSDANALVTWRNAATAASAETYTNYVYNATNGFTTVAGPSNTAGLSGTGTDQAFVSRQDLINYVKANPSQVASSALQYLGTFSRELNAPSYTPPASATDNDSFNPSLINTRVTSSFTRLVSDQTTANIGEPLIKYRFPLSRLNWIGYNGPNGGTAAQIMNSFGLSYSGGVWTYNHGSASSIMTLSQIAGVREPDFFELLQAAITYGSLGKYAANAAMLASHATQDGITYNQIFQIGANLIDQADSDSYPTRISFNGTEIDGIENLPYLSHVYMTCYRPHNGGSTANVGVWFQPEVWNPHSSATSTGNGVGPTNFQVTAVGSGFWYLVATIPNPNSPVSQYNFAGLPAIKFSTSSTNPFFAPAVLSSSVGASSGGVDDENDGSTEILGFSAGLVNAPEITPGKEIYSTALYNVLTYPGFQAAIPNEFDLQYLDQNNNPVTYSRMADFSGSAAVPDADNQEFETYPNSYWEAAVHSDPRTDRFGGAYAWILPHTASPYNYALPLSQNPTLRADTTAGAQQDGISFSVTSSGPVYLGQLTQNETGLGTSYTDPDGVNRWGIGGYADGNVNDGGYPLATDSFSATNSRPIVLNRPFRSVAEMGYAFRGEPWKAIDFFTANSGDAALLDLFCVNESPLTPVVAGKVDLNTRQTPVLQALLQGAIKSETDRTILSPAEASALVAALSNVSQGSVGPLLSPSELVTRWISTAGVTSAYSTLADGIIKHRREAGVRALADVANTRTWNLLIDVIAQSGHYPSNPTGIDQFVVEGERRYWLHVAIDRYTGKVIDQSLEPVNE